ncbi:hypothetical protein [Vulcanisaeta sp. JCM 16159]|uniref:hypothetical protein n=1 Tax=Vulcanisaeta sp. JCM 16159 TaxID=1295371 RepID=UPI000A69B431|nr:hypothetical protein [Vulcanisaeta sp. JCM 16159]
MSNGLSERGLIIVTAIVWAAIAVSISFIVAYTGIDGIPFASWYSSSPYQCGQG